jgi:hypothetical protein
MNEPAVIPSPTMGDVDNAYWKYDYVGIEKQDAIGFLQTWLVEQERVDFTEKLSGSLMHYIQDVVCWQARMRTQGWEMPVSSDEYFQRKLKELETLATERGVREPSKSWKETSDEFVVRIIEKLDNAIALVSDDDEIDLVGWMERSGVKHLHTRKLIDHYQEVLTTGQDFSEETIIFIRQIVSALEQHQNVTHAQKKIRPVKIKSPAELIAKLQYLEEFPKLDLKSVDPIKLIGASKVVVFDTKYNYLGLYVALEGGIDVHGTTLKNFDPVLSEKTKLSKPKVIARVLKGGKRAVANAITKSKTKRFPLTGRFNSDTVIIRVEKGVI